MEENLNSAEQLNQTNNQSANQKESQHSTTCWEYKVIHVNINNNPPAQPSTPETDSQMLQGKFSPEFIKREFPEMYQEKTAQIKNPVEEMQDFLNLLGMDGWELVEVCQIGVFMLFFKRLRS